jgi:4-carboxymuconolactone decarboxylase
MNDLNPRESVLVALGAAMGSNCIPCLEHLVPQARQAGLTDREIRAAIERADKVRQVPARKVLQAALEMVPQPAGDASCTTWGDRCAAGAGPRTEASAPKNGRGCC